MAFKFVCLGHNGIPRWEENRPNRRGKWHQFFLERATDEVVYVIYVCIYIYISYRIYKHDGYISIVILLMPLLGGVKQDFD